MVLPQSESTRNGQDDARGRWRGKSALVSWMSDRRIPTDRGQGTGGSRRATGGPAARRRAAFFAAGLLLGACTVPLPLLIPSSHLAFLAQLELSGLLATVLLYSYLSR